MAPEHEIYPMPLFVRLSVADLDASIDWYRNLGFETVYELPVMAHLRYRKYADVMLAAARTDIAGGRAGRDDDAQEPAATADRGVAIYLTVEDESVDDVAARANDADVEVPRGPEETSWNTREVVLSDPDGYEFVFAEPADPERSFEDVMGPDDDR